MFVNVSEVRSSSTSNLNIQATTAESSVHFYRLYDTTTNMAAIFAVNVISTSNLAK
jgi:hypothetical protein